MPLSLSPARIIIFFGVLLPIVSPSLAQEPTKIGVCHFQRLIPSRETYRTFRDRQVKRHQDLRNAEKEIFAKIKTLHEEASRLKEEQANSKVSARLENRLFEITQQGVVFERAIRDQTRRYFRDQKDFIMESQNAVEADLRAVIDQFAREHQFSLILDSSGKSSSGFPFVLHHSEVIDLSLVLAGEIEPGDPSSFQDLSIAVVDARKLFENHPGKKRIEEDVERLKRQFQDLSKKAVARLTRQFTQLRAEILGQRGADGKPVPEPTFSPEQREALQTLEKQRRKLEEWRARRKQALVEVRDFEFEKVRKSIQQALRSYAKAKSVDLILDQSAVRTSGTLILPGSLDSNNLTQEVQDYLREQQNGSEASGPAEPE